MASKVTEKNRAIVLQSLRYGDNSMIVKILTENSGLQSYIVKGILNKKSKIRPALFQNMTLVDIVATSGSTGLGFINEVSLSYFYKSIPENIKKTTIAIFINELIIKSITETETDEYLFQYIYDSMIWLDNATDNYSDFPLFFAMKLCSHLGFAPNIDTYQDGRCFDILDGNFKDFYNGVHVIDSKLSHYFYKICTTKIEDRAIHIDNETRHNLLKHIILYYKLHIDSVTELSSQSILHEILS